MSLEDAIGYQNETPSCIVCGKKFGDAAAYQSALFDGLHCGDCRKSGMSSINVPGREFAGRFSGKLEELSVRAEEQSALREFRDAMLNWIELHTERKLFSRELLETN